MSEVLADELPVDPSRICSLMGPSHAEEVSRHMPTSVVVAGTDNPTIETVQRVFFRPYFRVYTNPDLVGVELGVALKNSIAIAAGVCDGLEYGDSPSNHAMTLTGVNLDEQGKPNRWKVENSWGKDNGEDGYYVASDKWFDRYVTEIIIRKEYLDDATRALLETEPVELDPWQPLTKRCR